MRPVTYPETQSRGCVPLKYADTGVARFLMRIHTFSALAGLESLDLTRASVAVIDVFRASTTILCLMENGAPRIAVTFSVTTALDLKKQGYVVVGERGGRPLPGFDLDNSPSQVSSRDWDSCDVVVTTSNGTRALVAVGHSPDVIVAGFRNLEATVHYLGRSRQPSIGLIPIGSQDEPRAEDELCAQALAALLRGEPVDVESLISRIRRGRSRTIGAGGERFESDVDLALQLNATRIVPILDEGLILRPVLV